MMMRTDEMSSELMQELVLVRHAAATGQEADAPLSEAGCRQALALADALAPLGIEQVVASPFRRALQTAEPFCRRARLAIRTDARLSERVLSGSNLPDWREQLRRSFEQPDLCLVGGESSRAAQTRGVAAVLAAAAGGKRSMIVTHGNLLALLLQWVDAAVGYEHWSRLTNPDVFLVQIHGKIPRGFQRAWSAAAD